MSYSDDNEVLTSHKLKSTLYDEQEEFDSGSTRVALEAISVRSTLQVEICEWNGDKNVGV
jgi:hypothetical protein